MTEGNFIRSKRINLFQLKSRSRLLNILLFLSTIYIFSMMGTAIQKLNAGPLTETQLQQEIEMAYGSSEILESKGLTPETIQAIQLIKDNVTYINNHSFNLTHNLMIIISLIGFTSILLMFTKRMAGFYLYIVYSIASLSSLFIITPKELILFTSVLLITVPSVIFVFLYKIGMRSAVEEREMVLSFSE